MRLGPMLAGIAAGAGGMRLATSPGGLDSVATIAVGSGANIPFVLALQALCIFVVILSAPWLVKFIARYA